MKIYNSINKTKCLILVLWAIAVALVPNVLLCFTEHMKLVPGLLNVVVPCGFYLLFLSLFRKTGWGVIALLPVYILCAFQIVILKLYGGSIIAVDMFLNVVTTNVSEATELLGNLGTTILMVVILYLPILVCAVIAVIKKSTLKNKIRKFISIMGGGLLAAMSVIMFFYTQFNDNYKPVREIFPLNVIHNIKIAVDRTREINHYPSTSKDFIYGAFDSHDGDGDVYVLVIGETSRADNWQLGGYDLPTNPRLSKEANLIYYPRTLSQSNTTHKSVPMMMSCITADNFESIKNTKSIITAFKEAGYNTTFISNQAPNHSYTQYFGNEAHSCIYLADSLGRHRYDADMIEYVKESLKNNKNKQFIVLHSYGSHFKYAERYPSDFGSFKPDECTDVNKSKRNLLLNAYNNSIEYTDMWIDSLLMVLNNVDRRAAVIYSSDHGEDIMDDDRNRFLHASPTPTYYQLHVPMFVWVNDCYKVEFPFKMDILQANRNKLVSSTASVYDTMLDLAGINTRYIDYSLSLASESYTPETVKYVNDLNESREITDCGLDFMDFKMLNKFVF